ncbi:bifunctional folylpolyglutamate synthase/dihydrofolate synthase [Bacillus sp. RG28]|uniref:tetrahydrofolate synthase n=1 Tax=Gottfriedia endophytica TaxID=2820819 RepID=A0A940NE97_9BACI|nr:bifunctional folylpolyglutamate synthase/dihydrofolate synthase [Gottfriedia endophytica]
MFTSYEESIEWITGRLQLGITPGLERMYEMLERLGNPHLKINAIHVGGTNGKGSTISFLQNILSAGGYSVGTFTSPYIVNYNEQFSVNGNPILNEDFVQVVSKVKEVVLEVEKLSCGAPTEFEILTAIAFYYFGIYKPQDFVLIEVGLGGELDSTNVITPLISIITSIGYDHMGILGHTLRDITKNKAGIIKEGVPIISAVTQNEAIEELVKVAKLKKSPTYLLEKEFFVEDFKTKEGELFIFCSPSQKIMHLQTSMIGCHQVFNASCALMAIELLQEKKIISVSEKVIRKGLLNAKWVGRLEKLNDNPIVLIDGAHNDQGIQSLVKTIQQHYGDRKINVLFSALKDKEVSKMIGQLEQIASTLTMTTFDFPRAHTKEELFELSREYEGNTKIQFESSFQKAISDICKKIEKNDVILITGSLYFISNVRKYFVR